VVHLSADRGPRLQLDVAQVRHRTLDEARAYLAHPVLGPRLAKATRIVNAVEGRTIQQIFGSPDWMKFRSSMTLFARATEDNADYLAALDKYFDGVEDAATLEKLQS
jgi:uncharacterized protein (DUF1810 family)